GQQRLQHRGLAEAVAPDQYDLLAAVHDRAEVRDDGSAAVRLGDAGAFHREAAGGPVHRKLDVRSLNVGSRELGRLQPFDFLLARRDLTGAGAGAKSGNEIVELGDLLLALLVARLDLRAD